MPSNPRSLQLSAAYHAQVDQLAARSAQLVLARYRALDVDDLPGSLDRFVGDAATVLASAQQQAVRLSAAYFRALSRYETGSGQQADPLEDVAGQTVDGRPLEAALRVVPGRMFLAFRAGRPLADVLTFGRYVAARVAHTETVDAARQELASQMEEAPDCKGWRWRSRGTCAACLAMDDGGIRRPGAPLRGHPYCKCVQEPAFDVKDRVKRPTGRDRFGAMTPAQQDQEVGPVAGKLLRAGLITMADVYVVQDKPDWRRAVITAAPAAVLYQKAGIDPEEASNVGA